MKWIWHMAWRDSRGNRLQLACSVAAITLGVGAVVAIRAFSERLDHALAQEARVLLGADFSLRSLHPFEPETETFLRSLPGQQVRETRFHSMVQFPRAAASRLAHIHALSGPFPFYGQFDTIPEHALDQLFATGGGAIVEESLLHQYDLQVGDTLQIGNATFTITGRLEYVSGVAPALSSLFGPRIYIAAADLPGTELLRSGALARYYVHFRLDREVDRAALLERPPTDWTAHRLERETVADREALSGHFLDSITRYLTLAGLVAWLLGAIGLAGAIRLFVRQKIDTVALWRCLGATAHTAYAVHLIQVCTVALGGGLAGALLGLALEPILIRLLADFLPVAVTALTPVAFPFWSLLYAIGLALAVALWSLLPLRHIPPLRALRTTVEPPSTMAGDPTQAALLGGLLFGVWLFVRTHAPTGWVAAAWVGGLMLVLGVLTGAAYGLAWGIRCWAPARWPFALRQGITNIHRPGNQTAILLPALGFGAFLLGVLAFSQHTLLHAFEPAAATDQPNLILFDIQREQRDALQMLIHDSGAEHIETAPIVTMRLQDVNGRSVQALRDDTTRDIPDWILFREYRSTYREQLSGTEPVIAGQWQGRVAPGTDPVPVSIERTMAAHLDIGIGARLTFDIQGMAIRTRVQSIRQVDWRSLRTNFFVVFPAGVLEDAPQHYAMAVRAPDGAIAGQLQHRVSQAHPNVAAFDTRMWVQTFATVLEQAAAVVRFMAWLGIVGGLLVLAGLVPASRHERRAEEDLLHTLGATRRQIRRIMMAEYIVLGGSAALTGLMLAWGTGWAVARWVLDLPYRPAWTPLIWIPLSITAATLAVGYAMVGGSRSRASDQ